MTAPRYTVQQPGNRIFESGRPFIQIKRDPLNTALDLPPAALAVITMELAAALNETEAAL